jgi:hypothetical protein
MSHTPGPWWVDGPADGIEVHDTFGRTASVWGDQDASSEAWANASLIAAAPDLLAAARLANQELIDMGQGSSGSPALVALWAAIAKAEGRK